MKKGLDLRLIIFFTALTFVLTAVVIVAWEQVLRPPFFAWVDRNYPGAANVERRSKIQQRVEHFFISMTVDMVVVGILLTLVGRQQRRLVESESRYRALFEHANDGIGVVRSSDFKLVEANGRFCEILGCEARGLAGRDMHELLRPYRSGGNGVRDDQHSPPDDDAAKTGIAGLVAGSDAGEAELLLETPAGEARLVAVSFSTITTNNERLIIILIRDLSARKRLEDEKQEMQRQLYQTGKLASLGELSAGVAHEINNPLNGIINFAQLLKDEDAERTAFERQMIDGIIDEGGRIAQIVRGLLAFARSDENQLQHVHLAETIKTSIALFGRQLEKDGISVRVDIAP